MRYSILFKSYFVIVYELKRFLNYYNISLYINLLIQINILLIF